MEQHTWSKHHVLVSSVLLKLIVICFNSIIHATCWHIFCVNRYALSCAHEEWSNQHAVRGFAQCLTVCVWLYLVLMHVSGSRTAHGWTGLWWDDAGIFSGHRHGSHQAAVWFLCCYPPHILWGAGHPAMIAQPELMMTQNCSALCLGFCPSIVQFWIAQCFTAILTKDNLQFLFSN